LTENETKHLTNIYVHGKVYHLLVLDYYKKTSHPTYIILI